MRPCDNCLVDFFTLIFKVENSDRQSSHGQEIRVLNPLKHSAIILVNFYENCTMSQYINFGNLNCKIFIEKVAFLENSNFNKYLKAWIFTFCLHFLNFVYQTSSKLSCTTLCFGVNKAALVSIISSRATKIPGGNCICFILSCKNLSHGKGNILAFRKYL